MNHVSLGEVNAEERSVEPSRMNRAIRRVSIFLASLAAPWDSSPPLAKGRSTPQTTQTLEEFTHENAAPHRSDLLILGLADRGDDFSNGNSSVLKGNDFSNGPSDSGGTASESSKMAQ